MKQLIVIFSGLMLGLAIFQLVAGPDEGSVYSQVRLVFEEEIKRYER